MSLQIKQFLEYMTNLNGANQTKLAGLFMIFISIFFLFKSKEKSKLWYTSVIGIVVGSCWLLFSLLLGLRMISQMGLKKYIQHELCMFKDKMILTSTKFAVQLFLLLGLLYLFYSEEYKDEKGSNNIKTLGWVLIAFAIVYFAALFLMAIKTFY